MVLALRAGELLVTVCEEIVPGGWYILYRVGNSRDV